MKWITGKTLPAMLLGLRDRGARICQETTPAMLAAAAKEGKVVWYTAVDVKVAEAVAKVFRADYPEYRRSRSSARDRSAFSRDQPGVPVEHQERRCRQFVGRVAFHFLEAAEVACPSHSARREALPGAVQGPRRLFRGLARDAECDGLQHQPRSSRRTHRPAMPTCSTRNGKASWPNRIRATAAPV